MENESSHSNPPQRKLPRREFLANLLFAGGAISVTSFQAEYGGIALDPKDDGWELPDDKGSSKKDDWELPDDLLDSPEPKPNPKCPPPQPHPAGGRRPPRPPQPPGGIRPPHIRGKVRSPEPPQTAGVPIPPPEK